MILLIAAISGWIICGTIAYSSVFAYFQRNYPTLAEDDYIQDRNRALVFGLGGPIGLLGALLGLALSGDHLFKHGFKFR